MRVNYHRNRNRLLAVCGLLALVLAACGPGNANATPTMSVDAIYTAAYTTLIAQQATQLALTPPTNTPKPTKEPTLAPPPSPIATLAPIGTPTVGGASSACDSAVFVSDVTIPDNTVVDPGKKFVKTWRLLNKGSCTWTTSYKLAFNDGDQMGGADSFVTVPVAPGAVSDLSVTLTAPNTNGTYKGNWQMQNASNQSFGNIIYVQVKVGAGSTATAGPSPTAGPTAGAGQVTISGSFNVSEVTLQFQTNNTVPTVTYSGDSYSFIVPSGWSGTITPTKGNPGHWEFTPESKTFTNVTSNQTQDFDAVPVTPTP